MPGNIDSFKAFNVDGSQRSNFNATNNYAFFSNINTSTNSGSNAYNFYAAGSAPNYFSNRTNLTGDARFKNLADADDWGAFFVTGQFISKLDPSSSNTANGSNIRLCRAGAYATGDYITFHTAENNSSTARIWNDNGAVKMQNITTFGLGDYRQLTLTSFNSAASETVKLLNPGTNGFIAHELQAVEPSAVTGTKDAEEAIGTLADYDGTELETAIAEPGDLTYTEEVEGPNGRSVAITRTRTWTPTGTQPIYQGVDQTKLIPLLTKALQEVLTKNEDLEARITALEGA